MWKLRRIPIHTIISDASRTCLQSDQPEKRQGKGKMKKYESAVIKDKLI